MPAGTLMVCGPGMALARRIAPRSEQSLGAPLQACAVGLSVMVVTVRSSARAGPGEVGQTGGGAPRNRDYLFHQCWMLLAWCGGRARGWARSERPGAAPREGVPRPAGAHHVEGGGGAATAAGSPNVERLAWRS